MLPIPNRERHTPTGVGLGLRWDFLDEVADGQQLPVAFWEVSPENHMRRGGYLPAALERVVDRYTVLTHGLTMSFGAVDPPPDDYLKELAAEIDRMKSPWHSDHLCFSTAGSSVLHELLPLKLSLENANRAADHVLHAQERLGLPLGVENISWYAHPGKPELPEEEFITRVLERADCWLLLDVNNVFVNAQNHGFDPRRFIERLPLERVRQLHVAGHTQLDDGMLLDTHGAAVINPVYELLEFTLERVGPVPVLLERDNDIPPLSELLTEVQQLQTTYDRAIERWHHTSPCRQPSNAPSQS